VFLQLGDIPLHSRAPDPVPLSKAWWTLTGFRTVQYVQNENQRAAFELLIANRAENAKRIAHDSKAANP
jgi:hypothetical protein